LRLPAHDSGPGWLATPYLYDSCIRDFTPVYPGALQPRQKLVLRNWATAKEQECRVVHVREKPIGKNEVGIAFPFAIPKFWNVEFPPTDWTPFLS